MASPRSAANIAAEIAAQLKRCQSHSVADLRVVRRAVSKSLRSEAPEQVLRAVLRLVADLRVPRWVSYEIVNQDARVLRILTDADVARLGSGISTWGEVDSFGCYVAGPAWREGRLSNKQVLRWTSSPDRWWRRAALVSTVALNNTARGGTGDPVRTLEVCEQLKDDRDDMVVKAMSWALRELAKKDPGGVRAYVEKRESVLAPRVLREVRNKLQTGLKNPKSRTSKSHPTDPNS